MQEHRHLQMKELGKDPRMFRMNYISRQAALSGRNNIAQK